MKYVSPVAEIVTLEAVSVILASGGEVVTTSPAPSTNYPGCPPDCSDEGEEF